MADTAWTATSGDAIAVTTSAAADEFGNYPAGMTITLTPTFTAWKESDGLPKWGFARWEGNLADCTVDKTTGALTVSAWASSRTLVARFRHDWLYDASTKTNTIWNRVFRLNVAVQNEWTRTLRIYDWSGQGNAWIKDPTLEGGLPKELHEMANRPLDLDEPVTDADGAEWTIARLTMNSLAPWSSYTISRSGSVNDPRIANYPSQIVFPSTATALEAYVLANGKWDAYPLESAIVDCPNLTGRLERQILAGHMNLVEVVIRLPQVTELADGLFGGSVNGRLSKTDLSLWDLSSVTVTHLSAFAVSKPGEMTGTLKLPKLASVTNNLFCELCGMTGVEIGGDRPRVESIGEAAFSNCSALASIRISNKPTMTVGANAFHGTTALKDIRFNGVVPPTESVDAVLQARTAGDPDDYAIIRGLGANGWNDVGAALDPSLGEVAPEGETCFGVWRAGLRKAYLADWADAPWKLRGFLLFVR